MTKVLIFNLLWILKLEKKLSQFIINPYHMSMDSIHLHIMPYNELETQ